MDLELIKKLIKVVEKSEITDFAVEEGELKISISKKAEQVSYVSLPQQNVSHTPQPAVQSQVETQTQASPEKEVAADETGHEIKSPIVGTFYRAPSPEADAFVKVGDKISVGTTLCIVEAMKLMNEIESDINGTIVKILVENGNAVEYNQPMFLVKPD